MERRSAPEEIAAHRVSNGVGATLDGASRAGDHFPRLAFMPRSLQRLGASEADERLELLERSGGLERPVRTLRGLDGFGRRRGVLAMGRGQPLGSPGGGSNRRVDGQGPAVERSESGLR
jgi:hypothetical protein